MRLVPKSGTAGRTTRLMPPFGLTGTRRAGWRLFTKVGTPAGRGARAARLLPPFGVPAAALAQGLRPARWSPRVSGGTPRVGWAELG